MSNHDLPAAAAGQQPCDEALITAIELFHSDGKPSGIWYCSECRAVQNDKHLAQRCHGVTHCDTCGASLGKRAPHYVAKQCDECDRKQWRERQAKEEFERYTKAVKISASRIHWPAGVFQRSVLSDRRGSD